jgi:ERCC4-type nuclease
MSNTLRVLVDEREHASGIPERLQSMGVFVEARMLNVGDYILSSECALERKSAKDFVHSLYSGRLFDQARRLSEAYEIPMMLVEGQLSSLLDNMTNSRAFWGALLTLSLAYDIRVFFTEDLDQSAQFISTLARHTKFSASRGPVARGKPRLSTNKEKQIFVVSSLPGVGVKLAERLLGWFGSVRKVFKASIPELSLVNGVGRVRAETIAGLLDIPYERSEKSPPQLKLD